jgi:hypothetical protein
LQLANLISSDTDITQFADAGGDGVSDFIAGDDLVDHRARLIDGVACVRRKKHRAPVDGNFAYSFQR